MVVNCLESTRMKIIKLSTGKHLNSRRGGGGGGREGRHIRAYKQATNLVCLHHKVKLGDEGSEAVGAFPVDGVDDALPQVADRRHQLLDDATAQWRLEVDVYQAGTHLKHTVTADSMRACYCA